MRNAEKWSVGSSLLVWGVLIVIVLLVGAVNLSLLPLPLYYTIMHWLFHLFWLLVSFNLLVLIYYLKRFAGEKKTELHSLHDDRIAAEAVKLYLRFYSGEPINILLTVIFFLTQILIIAESFLLMRKVVFMWVLVVVLSFIAIMSKITPEQTVIKRQIGFIKVLSTCIVLFTVFALSTPFHSTFLVSTGWLDSRVFSNFAAERGDNFIKLLKKKMAQQLNINELNQVPSGNYLDTWNAYTGRLRRDNLAQDSLPHKLLPNGSSIHASFVSRALTMLGDGTADQKQQVMEALLIYLDTVIRKNQYKELKQDKKYRLGRRFLERVSREIETGKLAKIPAVRSALKKLYCTLKLKTTINPAALTRILTKEEAACNPQ